MIADIKKIIEQDEKYYYRKIKKYYPDFYKEIYEQGKGSEQLYCILYNDGNPYKCENCGSFDLKFQSIKLGFRKYCSNKCAANSIDVRTKYRNTSLENIII
jgi:hypothetical protein